MKRLNEEEAQSISALYDHIAQLRADLRKYGGHRSSCITFFSAIVVGTSTTIVVQCDCGWSEIQAELDNES